MPKPASRTASGVPALSAAFLQHMGFVVNKVAERLNRQAESVTLPEGLTFRQYGLLLLLQAEGPQAQIQLSSRVGLDRTSVMRSVDTLEARSLLRRDADPDDRRKHRVALTGAGAELLARTLPRVRRAEEAVTSALSTEEQALLMSLLTRLLLSEPGD